AGQGSANSVTWENRQTNVLGFVVQSSFFTQLRYAARQNSVRASRRYGRMFMQMSGLLFNF
ncbi:MAG: hypothetical protein V3U56_10540, partial [Syntrophobacteria bacterium]